MQHLNTATYRIRLKGLYIVIDRFASFEGNTGPYILYTIVRIKSIIEKYVAENGSIDDLSVTDTDNEEQLALMLELSKVNEVIENAAIELAPHKICSYIYDLSNAFNKFYHSTKILAEEDEDKKKGYIALISLCRKCLKHVLIYLVLRHRIRCRENVM